MSEPSPYSSKSAGAGDPRRVAAEFVDLWQDQIGALADNRNLSEALESMLAMLDRVTTAKSACTESGHDGDKYIESSEQSSSANTGGDMAARSAPAGPASGDDVERIDELRRRIAECQSRIAALES